MRTHGHHEVAAVRALVPTVYLPWALAAVGTGMLVPVLPLYLRDLGLSFTATSAVLAAAGAGAALGGVPAGAAIGRIGERRLLEAALLTMAIAAAALGATTTVLALVALRLCYGAGSVALRLASQTHLTRAVEPAARGRAMAGIGGSLRLAFLVGPLLGGWLVEVSGYRSTFAAIGAVAAAGLLAARRSPLGRTRAGPPPSADGSDGAAHRSPGPPADVSPMQPAAMTEVIRRHRRLLLRGGIGPALVMTVREGRNVVVPLVAISLDLSPAQVGAVVAVGTGADLALFPVSGYVMDRFGRLAAMIPAFGLLAAGLFVLAAATSASSPTMVVVAGAIMGVGNGLSAGTMLTLGSDLAPADTPGQFLAVVAAMQDIGKVAGPLLVGWMADAAGLGASATALGVAMVVGLGWIVVLIGETSER